ncbi:MAG: Pyridine nucleotide-disulfide oxidoreductase [Ilumatobacteraceae bacterium]|nr:Pyridine nucleotide-disulfide oxidoreductase [Ilumatobacteraceae bacterium]
MVTADDRLPYFRPHLSKEVLAGEMSLESVGLDNESWYAARQVDTRLTRRVTGIDLGSRILATDSDPIAFGQLVLAMGSGSTHPPIPGSDHPRVLSLRSASDAVRILERIDTRAPLLVVGSGFIGCEAAASVRTRGIAVTMASEEAAPQLARLGGDAAGMIAGWLRDLGVDVRGGRRVVRLEHSGSTTRALLDDGAAIECGWVIMATGAHPNIELAEAVGLTDDGAVPVDASMSSVAPGVFAVGDIVHAFNVAAGRPLRVEHWGDAKRMGSIAGAVAAGAHDEWAQAPGFWTSIAGRTIKYVAWGDGWDRAVVRRSASGITVWYAKDGFYAGVLTHDHDEDLLIGTALIESRAPFDL